MYDVIIIGAGVSGCSFAYKTSKYAKTLLIETQDYETQIPVRTNIFAEHNHPFIDDVFWNDEEIFPRPFLQLNYKSEKYDGLMASKEFGDPLGRISNTEIFLQKLIEKARDQGCSTKFNERISKIVKHNDYIELINNKGESYTTKLLALATGSRGFDLQKSLGFQTPDSSMGIYTNLYADQSILDENFTFQYMFHLNPSISTNGPFFFNVGEGRISTGYLGKNETPSELVDKLDRILKNYKRIQHFMKGLTWDTKDFVTGAISKHPISSMSKDRVIVLGEAAGIVTAFFYEGILCGLASSDVASNLIEPLLQNNSNFSSVELKKYDTGVKKLLLDGYFRNGNACEYLFFSGSSYVKSLWNVYTELLLNNKTVRQYVYEAHVTHDMANYNTDNDRWVGERLFGALPALSKLTLSPRFFKALLM